MSYDATDIAQLESIARNLESKAGIDPGALARDTTTTSKLRRIADSLTNFVTSIETHALPDHTDVSITTPADGDFLRYDAGIEGWTAQTADLVDLVSKDLDDLDDVAITAPAALDVVQYDGAAWVNGPLALPDLSDVADAAVPTSAHFLRGNGTAWTNAAIVFADLPAITLNNLSNVSAASPATFDRIIYNGSTWATGREKFFQHSDSQGDYTPVQGDMVVYNGTSGKWSNLGSNAFNGILFRDGSKNLTADWDAGTHLITNSKFKASTTAAGAKDNILSQFAITTAANDIGSVYRGLNIDFDYTNAATFVASPTVYGADLDIDLVNSGVVLSATVYGYHSTISIPNAPAATSSWAGQLATDGQTLVALQSANTGINQSLISSTVGAIYGAFTKAVNASTGTSYGYEGYGQNTSAGTGTNAVGVYGFGQSTSGRAVGVLAAPFTTGVKQFAFVCEQGNNHFSDGVSYFYTSTGLQDAATTTHITPGTDDGSVYIEKFLEVDNTIFADGDVTMAATKMLTIGVYADGSRPAAGTAGRVIFNTTDANLNIDDGTNWILPDGTTT